MRPAAAASPVVAPAAVEDGGPGIHVPDGGPADGEEEAPIADGGRGAEEDAEMGHLVWRWMLLGMLVVDLNSLLVLTR